MSQNRVRHAMRETTERVRRRGRGSRALAAFVALAAVALSLVSVAEAAERKMNNFPTYARAEYVYVCMSTNGQNELVLRQCSCAIDEIARRMTFKEYTHAETAIRMRQLRGEKSSQFKEVESMRKSVAHLRAAQAEAEIACF